MKISLYISILLFTMFLISSNLVFAQYLLVLNNSIYAVLNGGTSAKPINLVINATGTTGISGTGNIISESEFNYVEWVISNGTGIYKIPFYDKTNSIQIPFSMQVSTAGTAGVSHHVLFSTYHTPAALTPYATYNGTTAIPNIDEAYTSTVTNDDVNMVNRWWIVDAESYDGSYTTPSSSRPSNVSFNFEFSTAELNGLAIGSLKVQPFVYNTTCNGIPATAFAELSYASGPPSQVTVASIPVADFFRDWVVVNKSTPLPIELLSFNAVCLPVGQASEGDNVSITWATASETNNDYFTIERSTDATDFNGKGRGFINNNPVANQQRAAGNSNLAGRAR